MFMCEPITRYLELHVCQNMQQLLKFELAHIYYYTRYIILLAFCTDWHESVDVVFSVQPQNGYLANVSTRYFYSSSGQEWR